nr:MAG TPA: hypothetical protein [Caudoviricetes sp.]DAL09861.1 MAG TPA_asm: hypothetical protein [Caudoviricetes sp.]DAP73818.1 MAG TPA: hypothetical protein [Caudoviricetes sp.]
MGAHHHTTIGSHLRAFFISAPRSALLNHRAFQG